MQRYGKTLNDDRISPIFYIFAPEIEAIMKYFEVDFSISSPEELMQDSRDLLSALLGEAGFETFEETPNGIVGYVQQSLFNQTDLEQSIALFPFEDVKINYELKEADDKDWNEQWEQEGFEPIVVESGKTIVVHDGRHLPTDTSTYPQPVIAIEIDAHLAFGTGTHETTQMILATLLEQSIEGYNVLDCGCGTGILGIATLKLGAEKCVGYDIDEWSVENTKHNADINHVSNIEVFHGDSRVLSHVSGVFNVVVANINRNILMADIHHFKDVMTPNAILILSGFYEEDIPVLLEEAEKHGLHCVRQTLENRWACLVLS